MGKTFGELAKLNRLVYFRLSPYEQKAFAGYFSDGVPNFIRRFNDHIFRTAPLFLSTYMLICWAKEENHKMHRKDPKMYENDQ